MRLRALRFPTSDDTHIITTASSLVGLPPFHARGHAARYLLAHAPAASLNCWLTASLLLLGALKALLVAAAHGRKGARPPGPSRTPVAWSRPA